MPDVREVFEMVTQKSQPDKGSLDRQIDKQHRAVRTRKIGTLVLVVALIVGATTLALINRSSSHVTPATNGPPSSPPVISQASMQPTIVGLDGGVITQVPLSSNAWEPDLSPDGSQIVYVTRSPAGQCGACVPRPRLAVVKLDGTGLHYLFSDADVSQPVWSPDGTKVAFVQGNGSRGNIYVLGIDGPPHRPIKLTSGPAQKSWPSWSPDGASILYSDAGSSPQDANGFSSTQEIYTVAADGSGAPVRITNNNVDDSQAVYSPGGGQIALFHGNSVAIMNGDGSHLRTIPGQKGFAPRWSPDGSKIAFLTYNPVERYELPDPRTGDLVSWPRLDVKILTVATGDIADLGVSVASDYNAISWADKSRLLVNAMWKPSG